MNKTIKEQLEAYFGSALAQQDAHGRYQSEILAELIKKNPKISYELEEFMRLELISGAARPSDPVKILRASSRLVEFTYASVFETTECLLKRRETDPLQDAVSPPGAAELALYYILPREDRTAQIGDLQEEFSLIADKFGLQAARRWYWAQSIRTATVYLGAILYKLLRLGIFLKAASWVAQKFSG